MLSEYKQDSLRDLIKKYLQSSSHRNSFMSKAINEIKTELFKSDKDVKIHALLKLLFLYINNYDIKWASFNSLEIMSTCGVKGKLYAYLLSEIQFKNNSDFIQLVPNQIRSELKKSNLNSINSALNCANAIMDISLASEMLNDFEGLLTLNNILIRKKAIVALTLSCEQFAIKNNNFDYWENFSIKLISLLSMKDIPTGVSICIISSIQRMCKISPGNCMTIFVELMNYFTKCETNWNLIKIIDIFDMLFKHQPKFTRKKEFIKILSEQLVKTKSRSVEEELVRLIITNFDVSTNPHAAELISSSEERLKSLLYSNDNNLLILSLKIIHNVKKKEKYIEDIFKIIENNRDNKQILKETVDILKSIANKDNYTKIVEVINSLSLIIDKHAIESVIFICTKNNYGLISDSKENFIWFANMLFDIGYRQFVNDIDNHHKNNSLQKTISDVIRDMAQRVEMLRKDICEMSVVYMQKSIGYLKEKKKDTKVITESSSNEDDKIKFCYLNESNIERLSGIKIKNNNNTMIEVMLFAIGEYGDIKQGLKLVSSIVKEYIDVIKEGNCDLIDNFVICLVKLMVKMTSKEREENKEEIEIVMKGVSDISDDIELMDWVQIARTIVSMKDSNDSKLKNDFEKIPMNPLTEKANELVLPPKDLDLNACFPINEEELDISSFKKKKQKTTEEKIKIDTTLYTP